MYSKNDLISEFDLKIQKKYLTKKKKIKKLRWKMSKILKILIKNC